MHPGPLAWTLCSRLTTHWCKTSSATETPTRNLKDNSALEEEGSPAGDWIKLGGEIQIRQEIHMSMAITSTRTTITFRTWTRWKMQFTPSFRASRLAFAGAGPVLTRLPHCASSQNSHAKGTPLSMSTLLILRSHLTVWKLMRHYGIPEEITSIIRTSYSGMTCSVVCGRQLTDVF